MPSPCPCRGCTAAYGQGYKEGVDSVTLTVVNDMYRKGYTAGYNDHARSRAYAEQVYGPYTQHGKGENP